MPDTEAETPPSTSAENPLRKIIELFGIVTKPLEDVKTGPHAELADTLLCLTSEAMMVYTDLSTAAANKKVSISAYTTRSLMEIAIWTEYCISSPERTARFREDGKRDINGLRLVAKQMYDFAAATPHALDSLDRNAKQFYETIARLDIKSLDYKHKRVSDAADDLGSVQSVGFRNGNILLSKFTHPTSFMVNNVIGGEAASQLSSIFLALGTELLTTILLKTQKAATRMKTP